MILAMKHASLANRAVANRTATSRETAMAENPGWFLARVGEYEWSSFGWGWRAPLKRVRCAVGADGGTYWEIAEETQAGMSMPTEEHQG